MLNEILNVDDPLVSLLQDSTGKRPLISLCVPYMNT